MIEELLTVRITMNCFTSLQLPKVHCSAVPRSFGRRPARAARIAAMAATTERQTKKESIEKIKAELIPHIHETRCHPIVVRLAWHDSGSYDKVRLHLLCRPRSECLHLILITSVHIPELSQSGFSLELHGCQIFCCAVTQAPECCRCPDAIEESGQRKPASWHFNH